MWKSDIIKASRMWIYWKLANIPFYLSKWYIIFYLIKLRTQKHQRFNPGKTVVTCLEIFPGSENTLFSLSTFFSFTLGKNQQRRHLELRDL